MALVVRRETHIATPPATVFAFLTDPDTILSWMGAEATTEAHPGGLYLVKRIGDRAHVARRAFRQVVPIHPLAYSSPDGGSLRGHTAGPTEHIRVKDVVLQHCEFYSADRRLPRRQDADNQAPAPSNIQIGRVEKVACDNRAMDGKLILIDERDFNDQEAPLAKPVLSTYGESLSWSDRIKFRLRCSNRCKR
jgi:uncharacterized protein YndB with AHSA1/START domain